jgi:hypothetical protein
VQQQAQQRWAFAPSAAEVLNPMRGFRHQIDGFCGRAAKHKHPADPTGAQSVKDGIEVCKQLNMTVSLSYCYLSEWWNVSLPPSMLANLDGRLGDMRRANVTALLNFGYEDGKTNFQDDVEPFSFEQIYAHIDQLAPVLLKNADVIYGLQAGFIGNAGEWAHDIRGLLTNVSGLATFVSKLLYHAAPERPVLIRKGQEKLHMLQGTAFAHCAGTPPVCSGLLGEQASEQDGGVAVTATAQQHWAYGVVDSATAHTQASFARLGQYNAAFLSSAGDAGVFKPADMRSPWFAYFSREAPFVAVDGEMYFGTPWPAKQRLLVEGHQAASRMTEHHYRTFSHHNSYWPIDTEATPQPQNKSLNTWYHTRLNTSFIREQKLPLTDAYANASALRNGTVYEYIRDHLGYRLELDAATVVVEHDDDSNVSGQQTIRVELALHNNGFGAPVNARDWTIAMLSTGAGKGGVVWQSEPGGGMIAAGTDWRALYPHIPGDPLRAPLAHNITLAATLPQGSVKAGSTVEVGVALLDPLAVAGPGGMHSARATAVRFTNARGWADGVNVLGSVTV